IIMPHLHNKLSPIQFGKSLTPQGYSNLFPGIEKRIVPGDWLVDQFILSDTVDLKREWALTDLHEGLRGLSIVASINPSLFRCYTGLWDRHIELMLHPLLNPVYNVTKGQNEWILTKKVSDFYGSRKTTGDCLDLPKTISFNQSSLDQAAILKLKRSNPVAF